MKSGLELRSNTGSLLAAVIVVAAAFATSECLAGSASNTTPAYAQRGEQTEKLYRDYADKLDHAYQGLATRLKADDPALYAKFKAPAPRPVRYGYQILPNLHEDSPAELARESSRAVSNSYSWPRTEQLINGELPKIEEIEQKLKVMNQLSPQDRHAVYEKILAEYPILDENQKIIDSHVHYNKFWQATIAADRTRYDALTAMHDKAVERQTILDALAAKSDAEFRTLIANIKGINTSELRSLLEKELSAREKTLAAQIHDRNDAIDLPKYVKLSNPKPHVWTVEAPLYTDITDAKFLARFKEAIEKLWYVEDREDVFKLRLEIRKISPQKLYANGKTPKVGDHLDMNAHAKHFPTNGGALTTGSNTTYSVPGRFIALGPQGLSYNVAAHEFGHILGFVDGYFRGYHDLGADGFEVLEIVPDPDDIMCTPGAGHVRRHHFAKIIASKQK
jgi:hypothetical protein